MKRQFTNRQPINWRLDPDGALRITICALKEGVYSYGIDETPNVPELQGLSEVREYIPAEEFTTEACVSLEGKNVVVDEHEWRFPENALKDGLTVGAVAGAPYAENGELYCDALIYDPSAIKAITDDTLPPEERLVEVSAGYDGDLVIENGTFDGKAYDAKQTNLRFNHVLLLPAGKGRCGKEVRIINQKPTEAKMAGENKVLLKVQIGNAARTFRFSNEDDQREAETMLEEDRKFNAEKLNEAVEARSALEAQIKELQAQLAEHDNNLKEAKAQIEELLSTEMQEALAAEATEQGEDEQAIVEAEAENMVEEGEMKAENEDEEKEKILNSVRVGNSKQKVTLAMRRKNTVDFVLSRRGASVPSTWDQKAYDAAFETLAVQARTQNSKKKAPARVVNGKPSKVVNSAGSGNNRDRMLNPMRIRNKARSAEKGGA